MRESRQGGCMAREEYQRNLVIRNVRIELLGMPLRSGMKEKESKQILKRRVAS